MNMEKRCRHLGRKFDELYQVHYSELSWYVHSVVTGVANVQGESLSMHCGIAFRIIAECYASILEAMVDEFKIWADDKLKNKILCAKMAPFTRTQREIDGLRQWLGAVKK